MIDSADSAPVLLVDARGSRFALPLEQVRETMRPLPCEAVPGTPSFVRGLAIIRGESVPVVDLACLFGEPSTSPATRWVLLQTGPRRLALAVAAVRGLFPLALSVQHSLPPLLQSAAAEWVSTVSVHDQQLLLLLQTARLIPAEVWQDLHQRETVA